MSVESETPAVSVAESKSKPARKNKPADNDSRLDRKSPNDLSEKERKYLVERYNLDQLIERFGVWPTYYLLLRETSSSKPGAFVIGAGVIGGLVTAVTYYLKH